MRALLIGLVLLAGCVAIDTPVPVRTNDQVIRSDDLCDLWAAGQPVAGTFGLEGSATGAVTWLLSAGGIRQYLAWPRGFSARLRDGVVLDEAGNIAFQRDAQVTLSQVSIDDAAGTTEDPYQVVGLVENSCWIRR